MRRIRVRNDPRRRIGGRGRGGVGRYQSAARGRLTRFRQGSILAVAVTALFLMLWSGPGGAQEPGAPAAPDSIVADTAAAPLDSLVADTAKASASESVEEATGTLRQLAESGYSLLPKVLIAMGLLILAGLIAKLVKRLLRRSLGSWARAEAMAALVSVLIWLVALGAGLSVIVGDATALVGSVGLFGLALSWALQAPIESFSGWLLNSFRGYYRVGDRIEVGDVFGDVYKIDFLTTTVWEAGGPDKPVQAAQPTGALVTFPNSEVLRANVINYTRDFPYVWDEITINIGNDSDFYYAVAVFERVAKGVIGTAMTAPAERYAELLRISRLDFDVAAEPQVFVAPTDAFMNVTVRYLVAARERRLWASRLVLALFDEIAKPEHAGRITDGYPRRIIEVEGRRLELDGREIGLDPAD